MPGAPSAQGNPPQIILRQRSATGGGSAEAWEIAWSIENIGTDLLKLESVRLPHGQFKAEEKRFQPALTLPPGDKTEFSVLVRCKEPVGLVTENAFAIFYTTWLGEPWRIFARMRVNVTAQGKPQTVTESITTQTIGFSGVAS